MEISGPELLRLKNTIDYLENAVLDIVGFANDANTKIKYMHECKRIRELAVGLIEEIYARKEVT